MTATIDKIAWLLLVDGKILSTRSRGKDVYYMPGGKRESGESDLDTLVREIDEELAVAIIPGTAVHWRTFVAENARVQMACYTADYQGIPTASSEVEEIVWLTYADRHRVAPVDQLVFDHLHASGRLT